MQTIICYTIFILCFMLFTSDVSAVILKPSITLEMQRNSELQRTIKKEAIIRAIHARGEAVRKRNSGQRVQNVHSGSSLKPPVPTLIPPVAIMTPPGVSPSSDTSVIAGVDMSRVRDTWLSWYNGTRSSLGLAPYSYDSRLDVTAHAWNIEFAALKGQNHHRRHPSDSYYDFGVIDSWFKARGIDPIVINHAKHVENVGYGYYSCHASDCTDELIASIRSTYDFFMSEKGKSYDAHYRSIIQPNLSRIGLDIIVVPSDNRYYITIHYITK